MTSESSENLPRPGPAYSLPVDWTLEAPELGELAAFLLNVSGNAVGTPVGGSVVKHLGHPSNHPSPSIPSPYKKRVGSRGKVVKQAHDFALCVRLLTNLNHVATQEAKTTLGVHLNSRWYAKHREGLPEFVSKRRFERVYNRLLALKLVAVHVKGCEQGGSTRIVPTPKLIRLLESAGHIVAQQIEERAEIELRSPARKERQVAKRGKWAGKLRTVRITGKPLPFEETPETQQKRAELCAINTFLQSARIGWAETPEAHAAWQDMTTGKGSKRRTIRLTNIRLRRIFNEDWCYGGRFYGGWWQTVRGRYRRHITINDQPTIELDWEALHLRLCYAAGGQPAPYMSGPGQWYELKGVDRFWRPIVKLLTNQMLNSATDATAIKATMDERRKDDEPKKPGQLSEIEHWRLFKAHCIKINNGVRNGAIIKELRRWTHLIRDRHRHIAYWFDDPTSGGLLQNADSSLMEAVLRLSRQQHIHALPIHDSVVVALRHATPVQSIMDRVFNQGAGGGIFGQYGDGIKRSG